MRVRIDCEFSGVMRRAFRALGHDAWSFDLLPSEDDSPYHIQGDALQAGDHQSWDLIIAHPPCTYFANSGVRWLYKDGRRDEKRWAKLREAAKFWTDLWRACGDTPRAFENPVMHCHAATLLANANAYVKPQMIQPWWFGHPETKATGLYLHRLPHLKPTKVVLGEMQALSVKERSRTHYASPGPDRWKERSRTLPGIAAAMAEQWGQL